MSEEIQGLFPVQKQLIPVVLNRNNEQSIYPNDLCILAPTGSGKTLTYVLPLIYKLRSRIKPAIRAIVLVPVSDLAEQVYKVFQANLSDPTVLKLLDQDDNSTLTGNAASSLKVALLTNKNPLSKEQASLASNQYDILVATPGRLVDHIQKTAQMTSNMNLTGLNYLILDECDRVMDEIKQNWLPVLMNAVLAGSRKRELVTNENLNVFRLSQRVEPMQKILLSATLTRNPEKLEPIGLFNPVYFRVGAEKLKPNDEKKVEKKEKTKKTESSTPREPATSTTDAQSELTVPTELDEQFIQVHLSQKPLVALYLIKSRQMNRMLVFVNSKETAQRLNKLFVLNNLRSSEYSSALHAARRNRIQSKFESGQLDVLVCSDVMARGMDVQGVQYVLLYDPPHHLSAYIHKIGRTARAGRAGTAITLLEQKQVYFFKKMTEKIGDEVNTESKHKVREVKLKRSDLKPLLEEYRESLTKLKEQVKQGKPKSVNKEETGNVGGDGEEDKRGVKRRKKFISNDKFLKRIKKLNK